MTRTALVGWILVGVSAAVWLPACSNGGRGASARTVLYYRDPMHPSYTSDRPGKAPDCGMDLEPVYAPAERASAGAAGIGAQETISVDAERQRMIGVRLGRAERARTSGTLRALGRVTQDDNRVFPLRAGCEGWVTRVAPGAATGNAVRKGQLLASVYGRDYTTAQRSFLYALKASENPPPPSPGGDSGQPVLTLNEARLYLANLGMGETQIRELETTRQVLLDVRLEAPAGGVIVARNVFPKQRFDRDVELFRIADLGHVWIIAELLGDDPSVLAAGAVANVSVLGRSVPGTRATVSEALARFDGDSRALQLRLEADNPRLILRPGMFVDLDFPLTLPEATTVPADALVETGVDKAVYVDRGEGAFERRVVETGWRFAGRVEIVSGLQPDEAIVVSGNTLLEADSRMRRGDARGHD